MRIFELVKKSIECDILSKEEQIETIINSDVDIDGKLFSIKNCLKDIVTSQLALVKWESYTPNNEINNKE
jgi:hypothetical protein